MKHIDRETEEDSDADVAVLLRGEHQRLGRGLGKLIHTMKNGPRPINTSGSSYQIDTNMFLKTRLQPLQPDMQHAKSGQGDVLDSQNTRRNYDIC